MVRLVKGAYWDTEIKRTQERGLDGYPVYTRKVHTDVSYIACARKLLNVPDAVLARKIIEEAAVLVSPGYQFGARGIGHLLSRCRRRFRDRRVRGRDHRDGAQHRPHRRGDGSPDRGRRGRADAL